MNTWVAEDKLQGSRPKMLTAMQTIYSATVLGHVIITGCSMCGVLLSQTL